MQRAKLVLWAAEGRTNVEIGQRLGMSGDPWALAETLCKQRLEGIEDPEAQGPPASFLLEQVAQ